MNAILDAVWLPDPIWPVIVLAAISAADAIMCIKPVAFIAQCFTDVGWPREYWWIMAPIKFAAAAGLIAGIWIPLLGFITTGAVVLYFVVAISLHIRAKDYGRMLFINATGMLVVCVGTLVWSFLV